MTPERWRKVEQIYHSTLEREESQRSSFLKEACAGDEVLRREVESLLARKDQAENFTEGPSMEAAAKGLAEGQPQSLVGRQIGSYQILSLLGAGGMGEVYRAEDTRLGRAVAVKVLPEEMAQDKDRLSRFIREARAASALNHANVAHTYEIGQSDGLHFIAMEYVEGQSLAQKMSGQPLELKEVLDIGIQAADALEEAHRKGITHRDIKPANLMITPKGQVKVLDFGLAKITRPEGEAVGSDVSTSIHTAPGMVMGTLRYMSPEQVLGKELDARTDLFSLGVVLYEMTTGRLPFSGSQASEVTDRILHAQPEALARFNYEVPAELERIIRKCLEKDRERRYQSAREVLADLSRLKEGSAANTVVDKSVAKPRARLRRPVAVAALMLTVVALVYVFLFRGPPPVVAPDIKSLAVLPLANLSGDPSQEYFADGMTEALIAGFSKVRALRVTSRTSVMQYKGTRKPLLDIARELNVDAIVEGSVQRFAERVKITARLIHSPTERHLWVETYERDQREILALQSEIARAVVQEIQINLTPQEHMRLASARPVKPEAYDEYLRGRFYTNRQNKVANENAIVTLERSVAIDPTFASAHAELAQAYVWRFFLFTPGEKQWEEKAFVAVEKALSLDPDLAEAYLARGRLLWTPANHFPHEKAIQEYRRALTLNPNLDEAQNQLALVYNHIGAFDRALQELQKAVAINPSNAQARFRVGQTFLFQGKYEQALTALREVTREINPAVGHTTAMALLRLGRRDEAAALLVELLRDYPKDEGGVFSSVQALVAASAGEEKKAETEIRNAIEKGKGFGHFHHTAYHIACAYALMKKAEPAFKWLQAAADDGFPCYPLFERDPNLDSLRKDPRFITFMDNLKKQWEHYKATLGTGSG